MGHRTRKFLNMFGLPPNKDLYDVLIIPKSLHVDTVAGSRWVGIEYKMIPGHDNNAVKF